MRVAVAGATGVLGREAVPALVAAGHEVRFVDVREAPLSRAELEEFEAAFGAALLNTRSTTWRGLDAAERARPALDLLADHPTLMKRPLIVADEAMYLGWDARTRAALGAG